jgi:hypothetical protein
MRWWSWLTTPTASDELGSGGSAPAAAGERAAAGWVPSVRPTLPVDVRGMCGRLAFDAGHTASPGSAATNTQLNYPNEQNPPGHTDECDDCAHDQSPPI